jgi:hypothetical protein
MRRIHVYDLADDEERLSEEIRAGFSELVPGSLDIAEMDALRRLKSEPN